jgi:hypothetical protein
MPVKAMDVFPAIIRLAPPGSLSDITELNIIGDVPRGTRRVDTARAVIIQDMLIIAVDSPEGTKVVFRERVTQTERVDKVHYALTESGKIIAVTKDNNCGCGTRLRSWNPYGSYVPSTQDPNQ